MIEKSIRITALRAAQGGARLVLHIEITTETGVEKRVLSPLVARLDTLPAVGTVSEELFALYLAETELADALERAYRYLGAADQSPAAMRKKLRAAGVSASITREVLAYLTERGLLPEEGAALREAEKCVAKLWGNRRVLAAIRAKGYGGAALAAVASYLEEQDAVLRCVRLIEKRRIPLPDSKEALSRFAALLTRYGYTGSEIKAALRCLSAE